MYIYNLQKISCLKWNNFVWNFIFLRIILTLKTYIQGTLNELFIQFCFLGDLLKQHFFTRCLLFLHWWRETDKKSILQLFLRMLLKFEDKNLEIHKLSWLSITWILKKLSSMQTLVEDIPEITLAHWYILSKTYKKSHSKSRTLIFMKKFVCYPNNRLVPLRILNYRESTVVAPISSLSYII